MEGVWVQRDGAGAIVGRFANRQPGEAEEYLAEGSAELAALEVAAGLEADCAAIDAERDRRLAGGWFDKVTGKSFALDGRARTDFGTVATAALAELVAPTGARFALIPIDNDTLSGLAATETLRILRGAFGYGSALVLHARDLKNQVLAGGHPDTSTGWPV